MGNRTSGDDVEDHFWGTQGVETGGLANQVGLEQHRNARQAGTAHERLSGPYSSGSSSTSFEENLATLIGIAAWISISYYGIQQLALDWYWPVGVGLAVSVAMHKLLMGPLYFLLTTIKWIFVAAIVLGLAYLIVGN